ncbi:hypothetical protein [Companilactobacillus musae]|uniref:hypothetical protein n=1 Tax=Companilactobacillus musae TaxID=1903258 RepID=UPI000E65E77B|nr:hypothetical protein [Companilactobacillus musae]
MKRLTIKKLIIMDYKEKKAQSFQFDDHINIITSKMSSTGKSSLIKSIFYSLGFDIKKFPNEWNSNQMLFKEYIDIDGNEHSILRNKNYFKVDNEKIFSYKDYAKWLASQMDFELEIQLSKSKRFESVYPTEMLLMNYIDQDKSWDGYLYKNVSDSLNRYGSSKAVKEIVDYDLGISNKEIIQLKDKKTSFNKQKKDKESELTTLNKLNDDFKSKYEENVVPIDLEKVKKDLENQKVQMEISNKEINKSYSKIHNIRSKISIKFQDIEELNKIKNQNANRIKKISNKNGECSYCHSKLTVEQSLSRLELNNNIFDIQFDILKKQNELNLLKKEESSLQKELDSKIKKFDVLGNEEKFAKDKSNMDKYIDIQVSKEIQRKYSNQITNSLEEIEQTKKEINKLSYQISKLNKQMNNKKREIITYFDEQLTELSINLSEPKISNIKFGDFKEIEGSGTENNRAILGAYLSYFRTLNCYGNHQFPFGLDSVIKTEIDGVSLNEIYKAVEHYFLELDNQIFFVALEENLDSIKTNYKKIELTKPILSTHKYDELLKEMSSWLE